MSYGMPVVGFPETYFVQGLMTAKDYLSIYCVPTKNPVVEHNEGIVWIYSKGGRKPWIKTDGDHRKTTEYRDWRLAVFARDNFACCTCGQVGGNLEAHHIKTFNKHPLLRYVVKNGKTLCRPCHLLEHSKRK